MKRGDHVFNLNRLYLLQELQRRGSVLAVSDALGYSPSTVSQQLKVLEQELGATLIERVGRGVRLTREGEVLAERAASVFAEVERAEAAVAAIGTSARGDIKVATLQTASLALLPQALEILEEVDPHPRMLVSRIEPARALDALAAREFDIVVGEEYPGLPLDAHEGIVISPLVEDPLILAVPSEADAELTLSEIGTQFPWVMEPRESDARLWCMGMCRQIGVHPIVQFESDDLLVQMRLVETGHAIAVLPRMLLQSERPHLRQIELPGSPARTVFTAYRAGSEQAPAMHAVLEGFRRAAITSSQHPVK